MTHGNFTSAASTGWHALPTAHYSVRDPATGLLAATAYRGADIYAQTTDYYDLLTVFTTEADFPAHCIVNLSSMQYKYIAILVTALTGTSCACVMRPLALKGKWTSPDGLT